MRTTRTTAAEADAWLTVLHCRGHLHEVRTHADGTWTVRERPESSPWTLHHPVLAMDWIENLVRRCRADGHEGRR